MMATQFQRYSFPFQRYTIFAWWCPQIRVIQFWCKPYRQDLGVSGNCQISEHFWLFGWPNCPLCSFFILVRQRDIVLCSQGKQNQENHFIYCVPDTFFSLLIEKLLNVDDSMFAHACLIHQLYTCTVLHLWIETAGLRAQQWLIAWSWAFFACCCTAPKVHKPSCGGAGGCTLHAHVLAS